MQAAARAAGEDHAFHHCPGFSTNRTPIGCLAMDLPPPPKPPGPPGSEGPADAEVPAATPPALPPSPAPVPIPPSAPQPIAPTPAAQQGRFSPDGFWWWDGAGWRPAYSQDRLWRWNGQTWVPTARPPARAGGGSGVAIWLTVGLFAVVVFFVAVVAVVILLTMGNQIGNVFANVVSALTSNPTPSP